jgi:hypothetical protein
VLSPGQVYRSTITVYNQVSAPSGVTLTITKPDGTNVSPAPVIGAWTQAGANWTNFYDYTLPSVGLFEFTWTTTGPGTAPTPEYVNVRQFLSLCSQAEMKAHLNITSTDPAAMDELANFMHCATELVENKVGICVRRTFTERVTDARNGAIVLPYHPVLSVTSITSIQPSGPTWGPTDLIVDADAGIITTQWAAIRFWWGPWDVVFTAGRATIPERFVNAQKEQTRHLWETQRGSQPPSLLGGEEVFTATTGFTFIVTRRVLELLEQDMVPSS